MVYVIQGRSPALNNFYLIVIEKSLKDYRNN